MTCSVEGCTRQVIVKSRGWCDTHYCRWKRHGTLERTDAKSDTADGRLNRHGWVVVETGCWEWSGYRDQDGYGRVTWNDSAVPSHRLAYETWVGPIPEGLFILHSCDNPPCINPDHLSPGTAKENAQDRDSRNRSNVLRGAASPNSKLTEKDVIDIRRKYAAGGVRQIELASEYGVGQMQVSRIIRGERWSHVDGISD